MDDYDDGKDHDNDKDHNHDDENNDRDDRGKKSVSLRLFDIFQRNMVFIFLCRSLET